MSTPPTINTANKQATYGAMNFSSTLDGPEWRIWRRDFDNPHDQGEFLLYLRGREAGTKAKAIAMILNGDWS